MGLFDRLFGRKKQEPPIEEVVKEALENIDELEEETAPAPEAGENLGAEAVQSYQGEQQLDDQISDTKDSLADVEEPASQPIQEESKEPEHEREIIAENQTEETLEEHQSESVDEIVENFVEKAVFSDEASFHTEHKAVSYDEVATDSNNEFEPETEAKSLTESEQVDQAADVAEESEAAATEEPVELPQEESTQEKYDRSLKKTRTGFGARLNAFFANFRSVDEEGF